MDFEVIEAHRFCNNNKPMLLKDKKCGCFYCLQVFDPSEISERVSDQDGTAICPYCGVDSVIGEGSGYPSTKEFLKRMRDHWF